MYSSSTKLIPGINDDSGLTLTYFMTVSNGEFLYFLVGLDLQDNQSSGSWLLLI